MTDDALWLPAMIEYPDGTFHPIVKADADDFDMLAAAADHAGDPKRADVYRRCAAARRAGDDPFARREED
jgi:hypothetical protein